MSTGALTHSRLSSLAFLYDERVRNFFYQLLTAGTFAWLVWYLFTNTAHNLEIRGMNSGFGFMTRTAGVDTDKEASRSNRTMILDKAESEDIIIAAGHFHPDDHIGKVVRMEGKRYWQVIK